MQLKTSGVQCNFLFFGMEAEINVFFPGADSN
jgi:hypothetical protein